MEDVKRAADLIKKAKYMVALTGAGMSTESGIPDFRSNRGIYETMPEDALSREVLERNPRRFYREGYRILDNLAQKKPNPGHLALSRLQEEGYLKEIITQNIDNLHTKAGSKEVYEVHGETRRVRCTACAYQGDFQVMKDQVEKGVIPPQCPECGRPLRPNVVMFGDPMPPAFEAALGAVERADTMLIIGSSLQVMPVAYLPQYVDHLIIINQEPTPFDTRAEVVIHRGAGQTLEEILKAMGLYV
ncbi:MAG: NAD-dependent deacylase [Tissierellia bacterium]|nr:NAD-dependent deacylase [Tissierellia bacterium]